MGRIPIFALVLICSAPVIAGENTVSEKLIRCAPATYEQALSCLDTSLTAQDKADLAKPDGPIDQHMGLGIWMRNNWGLWKQGPLWQDMHARGLSHPDDISGAIMSGYSARLRGERFDLAAEAAETKKHWDNMRTRVKLPFADCADNATPLETVTSCERDGNGIIHVNDPLENY